MTNKSETNEKIDQETISQYPCDLKTSDRVLVERILRRLERENTVEGFSEEEILHVLHLVYQKFQPMPSLINVDIPVVIFGDLHG